MARCCNRSTSSASSASASPPESPLSPSASGRKSYPISRDLPWATLYPHQAGKGLYYSGADRCCMIIPFCQDSCYNGQVRSGRFCWQSRRRQLGRWREGRDGGTGQRI